MSKKQVTFADIAAYTHFSKTTISRYFNHPDSLTLENQEKISKFSGNFSTVKEYATVDESDPNRDKKLVVLDQLNTACARPSLPEWLSVNDLYLSAALEDILADDASADIIQEKLDYAARQATAILFS